AHDYATLKLSLKAHPVSFFRPEFDARRVTRCEELTEARDKSYVRVSGLVLVRQRPGTASGVIFCTLEDETGIANIIVWPKVFERYRKTVMRSRFLMVEGRVQKEGLVIHVVAEKLIDLSERLADLADGSADDHDFASNADEARSGRTEDPRAIAARKLAARRARAEAITPKSRDFH
ncbi:MAG: OB-fold nucleic acid binding domain-containing protein, partial [Maricaulaceae bacterium]